MVQRQAGAFLNPRKIRFSQNKWKFPGKQSSLILCTALILLWTKIFIDSKKVATNIGYVSSYNLPLILNIPNYLRLESPSPGPYIILREASRRFPNSIAAFYLKTGGQSCGPNFPLTVIPALRTAVKVYGLSFKEDVDSVIAQSNFTLTVQISGNNIAVGETFLQQVLKLSNRFSTILLAPVSINRYASIISLLRKALAHKQVFVMKDRRNDPDSYFYILSISANLFAHGSADGALAALSNTNGKVYISRDLDNYQNMNQFRWNVKNSSPYNYSEPSKILSYRKRLNEIGMVEPTCCQFQAFGFGDQEKVVCTNAKGYNEKHCWVLSLGSNNKWMFEQDVFARTNCIIQVFDCTGNFEVPSYLKQRVFFHKICVGSKDRKDLSVMTLSNIIKFGSRISGHTKTVAPMIAKIDIEGWEIPSFRPFLVDWNNQPYYPPQILMEIHVSTRVMFQDINPYFRKSGRRYEHPEIIIRDFIFNLSRSGYRLVHRADNPNCLSCSEVNLLYEAYMPVPTGLN